MPSITGQDQPTHAQPALPEARGPEYWRSLDERADSPEFRQFAEREFPSAGPLLMNPVTRRQFIKLMGASTALAGMTGCKWPEDYIVPYNTRPEHVKPGIPLFYATGAELAGVMGGLLAKQWDGRPIKIEGNPEHPTNRGATTPFEQAAVLELYNPRRSRSVVHRTGERLPNGDFRIAEIATIPDAEAALQLMFGPGSEIARTRGAGLWVLTELTSSLSFAAALAELKKSLPQMQVAAYEPVNPDNEILGGELAFGWGVRTHYDLSTANVIVSFDADLLGRHPNQIKYSREFAMGRRPDAEHPADKRMNRLYVFESTLTTTGAAADLRQSLRARQMGAMLARIAKLLLEHGVVVKGSASLVVDDAALPTPKWLMQLVSDLVAAKGQSVVAVGANQPPEVQALGHAINAALLNTGKTVIYTDEPLGATGTSLGTLRSLTMAMAAGQVNTLVILGGNPVYDAPADFNFPAALTEVDHVIQLSHFENETSLKSHWHIPRAHFLESWGDGRAYDGTVTLCQPIIAPLYNGLTSAELLYLLSGHPRRGAEVVRSAFDQLLKDKAIAGQYAKLEPDAAWQTALHDGIVRGTAFQPLTGLAEVSDRYTAELNDIILASKTRPADTFEVVFLSDAKVYDGRFAHSPWLQELPEPLTKVCWDNCLWISPADAAALRLVQNDVVSITLGKRVIPAIAVYIMPGMAPGTVAVTLGYGNVLSMIDSDQPKGFNVYPIRTSDGMGYASGAVLTKRNFKYMLATTQDHWAIDERGRAEVERRTSMDGMHFPIYRQMELSTYKEHPEFAKREPDKVVMLSLFHPELGSPPDPDILPRPKWGMTIDLSACTGCSSCIVACMAENNIPVVGKDEVARGREMHWIRTDRYFSGDPDAADGDRPLQVHFQTMLCVHCETAPCEAVCPVAATLHGHEGLNEMIYNRCIGTRYCSNNCPYKVRRFNWFYNWWGVEEPQNTVQKMVFNPEVTVRGRGVMEKCTFCVQRIKQYRIDHKNKYLTAKIDPVDGQRKLLNGEVVGVRPADGTFTTACAQACPSQAIVFGDLADREAQVTTLYDSNRAYAVLGELNTKPRVHHLAAVKNTGAPAEHPHGGGHAKDAKHNSGHAKDKNGHGADHGSHAPAH